MTVERWTFVHTKPQQRGFACSVFFIYIPSLCKITNCVFGFLSGNVSWFEELLPGNAKAD